MKIVTRRFQVAKRYPLTISRGTSSGSENLLVELSHDGITGIGEMAPTSGGATAETAESAEAAIAGWAPLLLNLDPMQGQRIDRLLDEASALDRDHAARAALDIARYDWIGRRLNLPVWRILQLDRDAIPITSITIGINPPEVVRERVQEILARTGARALKVKLGSPDGLEADRAILSAAQAAAPTTVRWRVDANGGWSVEAARSMLPWLATRGVELVEQPLARGHESDLRAIHHDSPLPIFVDESVYLARDIAPIAGEIDGVNLKLMKCGGISEALRIIHTARAHGLRVMIGCMSETSLAISAAAHISALADALDLDSHLNLLPDPYLGAQMQDGRIVPGDAPGLGVSPREGA